MNHPIVIVAVPFAAIMVTVWFAAIIVTFRGNDKELQTDALLLPVSIIGEILKVFLFLLGWVSAVISFILMFTAFFAEIIFYVIVYYNPVTKGNILRDFAWNIRNVSIRREVEQHIKEYEQRAETRVDEFKKKANVERNKAKFYEKQIKKLVDQEKELRYYINAAAQANSVKRVREELTRYGEPEYTKWGER